MTHENPARQLAGIVGDDKARAVINAGWNALRPIVETGKLHAGVADYAATVVALAVLETLNLTGHHRIEFRAEGWTIQHTIACRDDMFGCPLNRAAQDLDEPPSRLGIYECRVDPDGQLEILGLVTDATAATSPRLLER